jgi:hypothetical protein
MVSERGSAEALEAAADEPAQQNGVGGAFARTLARLEDVSETFSAALHALETITCPEKVRTLHRMDCSLGDEAPLVFRSMTF